LAGLTDSQFGLVPYSNIQTRRLYIRVSTSDKGQTVESQLQPLQEAAGRLGWRQPWRSPAMVMCWSSPGSIV
jgi:hypothetical protein